MKEPTMPVRHSGLALLASLALGASMLNPTQTIASEPATAYKMPPDIIRKALDAAPLPGVSLDPKRRWMVLIDRVALPPVSDLAQPMLRLGGDRYNPNTNGPFGPRRFVGFSIRPLDATDPVAAPRSIDIPAGGGLSSPIWSPDGSAFAFTRTVDRSIELWIADPVKATARKLADGLNAASGSPFRWMPDSRRLLVRFIPANRGPMPVPPPLPTAP